MSLKGLHIKATNQFKAAFLFQAAANLIPGKILSAEDTRYYLMTFIESKIHGFAEDELTAERDWANGETTEEEFETAGDIYHKGFERGFLYGMNCFQDLVLLMQEKEKPADDPGSADPQANG